MIARRHLRQLQHRRRRREGHDRGRRRTSSTTPDGLGARRGLDRIRTARRSGAAIRPTIPRSPTGCAPRPSGTTASRSPPRTSSSRFEAFKKHIRSSPPTTAMSSRRRRPASARSPSRSTSRATASCRRSSASSRPAEALVGRHGRQTAASATSRATTLEPPLGSGAYRIKEFVAGRTIVYERVKDYWGKDLNVNIGRDNFDEIRYEYFRDATVALEAFKADQIDWRTENSAKDWATGYDFPAVQRQARRARGIPDPQLGLMQGFVFNPRRDKFKDPRVRRAFNYALRLRGDEQGDLLRPVQAHRQLLRRAPKLASRRGAGLPRARSSKSCETVRDKVPAGGVHHAVHESGRRHARSGARQSARGLRLLQEAGYEIRDRKLVNVKTGEPFSVEIPRHDPNFERVVAALQAGARAARHHRDGPHRRHVAVREPAAQLGLRHHRRGCGRSRCRPATSSATSGARRRPTSRGSRNFVGIKNPAVDALIERIIFAKDREELVAATKALDRVLLWNHYVVPQWTYGKVAHARAGTAWPARHVARIRRSAFRRSGGGTQARRRQDRSAPVTTCAEPVAPRRAGRRRRRAAAACAAGLRRRRGAERNRDARPVGLRRPEISGRLHRISTTSTRTRRRAACSRSRPEPAVQPVLPDLQLAQRLHPQGRRRAGHGADLRTLMARPTTSRTRCTASPRAPCASPPTG